MEILSKSYNEENNESGKKKKKKMFLKLQAIMTDLSLLIVLEDFPCGTAD